MLIKFQPSFIPLILFAGIENSYVDVAPYDPNQRKPACRANTSRVRIGTSFSISLRQRKRLSVAPYGYRQLPEQKLTTVIVDSRYGHLALSPTGK